MVIRSFVALVLSLVTFLTPINAAQAQSINNSAFRERLAKQFFPKTIWRATGENCDTPANGNEPGFGTFSLRSHPYNNKYLAITYSLLYAQDCGHLGHKDAKGDGGHFGDVESFAYVLTPNQACPNGWGAHSIKTIAHGGHQANEIAERVIDRCDGVDELIVSLGKHAIYQSINQCLQRIPSELCTRGSKMTFNLHDAGTSNARVTDNISQWFPRVPINGKNPNPGEYIWKNPGDGRFCGGLDASNRASCVSSASNHLADPSRLPSLPSFWQGGLEWGETRGATAVAFGDLDGDGVDELAVGRDQPDNARLFVYKFTGQGFRQIYAGGEDWGKTRKTTALAFGDVNGDGREELIVGRNGGNNARFYLYQFDKNSQLSKIYPGGNDWGNGRAVTAIATGDLDGDGVDELAVGRDEPDNPRLFVYKFTGQGFRQIYAGGEDWGKTRKTTALAFGDVNGDGREELIVGRNGGNNARFFLYQFDKNGQLSNIYPGGNDWGNGRAVTAIATGDFDGDGVDELAIGRDQPDNARLFVYKFTGRGFRQIYAGGEDWGKTRKTTALAFGDVDADGREELAIGRNDGDNARILVLKQTEKGEFSVIYQGGTNWGDSRGVTGVAYGKIRANRPYLAIVRNSGGNARIITLE